MEENREDVVNSADETITVNNAKQFADLLDRPISIDDLEATNSVGSVEDSDAFMDKPISLDDLESPILSGSSQEAAGDNLKLINTDNDLDFINIDDEYNVIDFKKVTAKLREDFNRKYRLAAFLTKIEKNLSSKFETKVQNESGTKEVLDQALDKMVSASLNDSIEINNNMILEEQGRGK